MQLHPKKLRAKAPLPDKKYLYAKGAIFCSILVFSSAFAHPGRTDAESCHKDRKVGERHCHKAGKKFSAKAEPAKSPSSHYKRKEFGSWIDADGDCQNTRHEVLIEESLIPVKFKTSRKCKVLSGKWHDPYTNKTFTDPALLDVDHVVPLKEAFLSGADSWPRKKRKLYANDLNYEGHLIAVSSSANRKKGAKDPAHWLPPNKAYWKEYVKIWLEIKKRWELKMDRSELKAIQNIIEATR